jgi:hypothetical protein
VLARHLLGAREEPAQARSQRHCRFVLLF